MESNSLYYVQKYEPNIGLPQRRFRFVRDQV